MSPIAALSDPYAPDTEAYRGLRTNLLLALPGAAKGVLAVTSPSLAEDKSTVLANLAVVTAQTGRRVTVVDCDLRRPMQHRLFELANEHGVSTILAGEGPIEPLPWQAAPVAGLRILTSGPVPPNPAELLGSQRFADLLAVLTAESDLALVDVPPVLPVADAAIVAAQVYGVLLVLAAGRSRRDHARQAKAALERVGARVIGAVLTGVASDVVAYPAYGRESSP